MITNPKWRRIVNIAKVNIELMKVKLQMEFSNGNQVIQKNSGQNQRQLAQTGEREQSQTRADNESQRGDNLDSGADDYNT